MQGGDWRERPSYVKSPLTLQCLKVVLVVGEGTDPLVIYWLQETLAFFSFEAYKKPRGTSEDLLSTSMRKSHVPCIGPFGQELPRTSQFLTLSTLIPTPLTFNP